MENSSPKNRIGWRRFFGWKWLAVLPLLLGVAAAALWLRPAAPPPPPPPPAPAEAQAKMESLCLTETEDGGRRWCLNAKKADFLKDRGEIRISDIQVDFFGYPGGDLRLKCQEGLVNTKTRALTLKGGVEIARGDLLIKTDLVTYQPEDRVLVAPGDITLERPTLKIQGKDLKVDLAHKKLVLAQHHFTELAMPKGGLRQ
ncbi:MAG: LPS export ABC transporter periplasmic protein LptC [Thermodesulfobacteriota bacterium]